MDGESYRVLDTKVIDSVIAQREHWIQSYRDIEESYKNAVSNLLDNWKGRGADAFREDTRAVQRNIASVYDILRTMCDMLADCREVFSQRDKGLGDYNRG